MRQYFAVWGAKRCTKFRFVEDNLTTIEKVYYSSIETGVL